MIRNPMRQCGRQYADEAEALRSKAGQRPGAEVKSCRCGRFHIAAPRITASRTSIFPAEESRVSPRKPIRPVRKKRARENRVRRAMADRLWPDRHEGTVMCGCGRPECHRPADDLHETLSRARSGGDITSPDIWVPLSRVCHDEITLGPEWAYRAGLLKHNGPCCQGRRVCSRYAQPEAPKAEAS